MAVIDSDGYEAFTVAQMSAAGYAMAGTQNAIAAGRLGGSAWRVGQNSSGVKTLPAGYTTIYCGWAMRIDGSFAWAGSNTIQLRTAAGAIVVALRFAGTGLITAHNSAGTVLGTSTFAVTLGAWFYIEVKVIVSATVGVVEVKVNGATEINATGLNLGTTAIQQWGQAAPNTGGPLHYADDLWFDDAAFLGDCRVETIYPTGNGTTSNMVGSDGNSIDNYLLVDDANPNDDTDYVSSSTVGDKDTYQMGNLTATSGTVYAVVPKLWVRKDDAGARSAASVIRLSATEVDSASVPLSTTYLAQRDVRNAKPGGGSWTVTDVNAMEVGVKVSA